MLVPVCEMDDLTNTQRGGDAGEWVQGLVVDGMTNPMNYL